MEKVTIIIPTYNRKSTVKRAINSVLSQTYTPIKCIVVDDCSDDNTYEELSSLYQKKITIFKMDKNSGQSACRNFGAEKAETEFISFLDSDDFIYENAVSLRMQIIENSDNPNIIPFGLLKTQSNHWEKLITKKNRGEKLSLYEYIENRSWCNNNSFIVRKNDFFKVGGYNVNLRDKEDIELILKLMTLCDFIFCGEIIGEVTTICAGTRQRERYDLIIAQGNEFTESIKKNNLLMEILGEKFNSLLAEECEGILRALYKSNMYEEFRKKYSFFKRNNQIKEKKTFFKRFFLSYILQLIKTKPSS